MIKLPRIDESLRIQYLRKQKKTFANLLNELNNSGTYPEITNYFFHAGTLDNAKVEDVLIGNVDCLIDAINSIGPIDGNARSSPQREFINLYQNYIKTKLGTSLFDKIGVKVCPYCNRSYIHTLQSGKVRPQYDHFFSKVKYPYLAISLYNLIPSCGICNQAKSDTNTYDIEKKKLTFLYPYRDEYGEEFFFRAEYAGDISYLLGGNQEFDLKIENLSTVDSERCNTVHDTVRILHTAELYQKHKDYVLDIIRNSQIYTDEYMKDLLKKFPHVFRDISDVQRFAFMNYLDKPHWGDRVLAKLTYDIHRQFHT